MTDQRWANFGYPSQEPCVICGKVGGNQIEPRFGYTICRDHADMAPVEIGERLENRLDIPGR